MASSVVLVNGLPGSGKSTLARTLAAELDAPLLSKSLVKAGIVGSTPHMGLPGAIYGALASRDRLRARERFAREWDDLVAHAGPLGLGDLVSVPSLEPVDAADVAASIRPLLR